MWERWLLARSLAVVGRGGNGCFLLARVALALRGDDEKTSAN